MVASLRFSRYVVWLKYPPPNKYGTVENLKFRVNSVWTPREPCTVLEIDLYCLFALVLSLVIIKVAAHTHTDSFISHCYFPSSSSLSDEIKFNCWEIHFKTSIKQLRIFNRTRSAFKTFNSKEVSSENGIWHNHCGDNVESNSRDNSEFALHCFLLRGSRDFFFWLSKGTRPAIKTVNSK